MKELEIDEYYALFDKLGFLRTPMLHKSKRQIRKVWALLPDAAYVRARKIKVYSLENIELNPYKNEQ